MSTAPQTGRPEGRRSSCTEQIIDWNWLMELAHQRRLTTQDRTGSAGLWPPVLSD